MGFMIVEIIRKGGPFSHRIVIEFQMNCAKINKNRNEIKMQTYKLFNNDLFN